ncbi:DUF378 domain-containing protein [Candidatus Nomurabacteria bacterium]|nr:DUF378 domain-containing protein [Candidatus Nomurabacteria bacterium]
MKSTKGKGLHVVTFILIIVGALNWGLVGFFGFDLVAAIFGDMSAVSRIVYALVGVAAVVELVTHRKSCVACCKGCCDGKCGDHGSSNSMPQGGSSDSMQM